MLLKRMRIWMVVLGVLVLWVTPGSTQPPAPTGPVNFKKLVPYVNPPLPGWKLQGKPTGTTVKSSYMKMSQAEARFTSGDKSLRLAIVDSSIAAMASLGMGVLKGIEVETSEEVTKSVKVQDYPAIETYKPQDKEGKLTIVVADRFVVTLEGEGIENIQELEDIAQHLELKKLAALSQ